MKVGIYFCQCGGAVSGRIDGAELANRLAAVPEVAYFETCGFLCAADGKEAFRASLERHRPDRVVVGACSPREYEGTFRRVLSEAGLNPYFLQMVNLREQVSWVTEDPARATAKACRLLQAAVARVQLHEPLQMTTLEANPDVVVVGAGPGGLKCALALAMAGRKVTLVEKSPVLGGMPVQYEELFPAMECGPCLLEPMQAEVLHGPHASQIECLTLAQVVDVVGYYGNFTVRVEQSPRFVDERACIGCMECIPPCPASAPNPFNAGMDQHGAISLPFLGALPNVPYVDAKVCVRSQGSDCRECLTACPVEGAVKLDAAPETLERQAGAVVVATGAALFDAARIPALGYGSLPNVYTSLEFERMLAANGPTSGEIRTKAGLPPRSTAIIHCVGSLDDKYQPYCSGVCCESAFKFNRLIESKLAGTRTTHFYRELVMPGKEDFGLYRRAWSNPHSRFVRFADIAQLSVSQDEDTITVVCRNEHGVEQSVQADMVILCPAVVPSESSKRLAAILDLPLDRFGFFEELHGRTDSAESKRKGFYLAGACQAPMDIQNSISRGMVAAGYVLAGLVKGKELELEPVVSCVDEQRCAGCRLCWTVCPFKAIGPSAAPQENGRAARTQVSALLCQGCGTCVSACPAGAIQGNHFTNLEIFAEMEAILQ